MTGSLVTDDLETRFSRDGFCLCPEAIPADVVREAVAGVDAVLRGEYRTGTPPAYRSWEPGGDPAALVKIDQAHLADDRLLRLVSHPAIGTAVAAATGASLVQVWAVQLLHKPGGEVAGTVGWHQDLQYWQEHWDGEVLTAWLAVSDVTPDAGPVRFVVGSHRWGLLSGGDFFATDLASARAAYDLPDDATWEEVPAVLPPGGLSLHHRLTVHGSGPNSSSAARRAIAVHVRTERSTPKNDAGRVFGFDLDDMVHSPVVHRR